MKWLTGLWPVPSLGTLSRRLNLPLAGFLTHPPIFCLAAHDHLQEMMQGGVDGAIEPTSASSETVVRHAFEMLVPKHRLLKHSFQNIDGNDPSRAAPGEECFLNPLETGLSIYRNESLPPFSE